MFLYDTCPTATENPFFGHYGIDSKTGWSFAGLFTPLGGVTHKTSAAFYGVGPNHQDLAIHQDALILNYFGVLLNYLSDSACLLSYTHIPLHTLLMRTRC